MHQTLSNPSFQATHTIKEIMSPTMKANQLDYFGFVRLFPNKAFINLVTDNRWSEYHYFEEQLPPAHLQNYDHAHDQLLFFNEDSDSLVGWPSRTIQHLNERFSLLNMLNIVKRYDTHLDVIGIVSAASNAQNYFLDNLEFIESFIHYFKDKASDIIQTASNHPLYYSTSNSTTSTPPYPISDTLPVNKIYLSFDHRTVGLTRREYEVLGLLAKGSSVKHSAHLIGLSARTVEEYFNNIKNKFGIRSRSRIFDIYWKNKIINLS